MKPIYHNSILPEHLVPGNTIVGLYCDGSYVGDLFIYQVYQAVVGYNLFLINLESGDLYYWDSWMEECSHMDTIQLGNYCSKAKNVSII